MRENCTSGSAQGAPGNGRSYCERRKKGAMNIDKSETFSVPRLFSFIDWAYLQEALKVVDSHFEDQLKNTEDRNKVGNLNATRQSLYRAAFISAYGTLEQNLDEQVRWDQNKNEIALSPNDLKHRGVKRSIIYAQKVLMLEIDDDRPHWKNVEMLQELRNHMVHFGSEMDTGGAHKGLYNKLKESKFVSFTPIPSFSLEQLDMVINEFIECIEEFSAAKKRAKRIG